MHPGDIRVVTAVKPPEDSPFYRHSDCVVLPIRGYQPLADKMGGGKQSPQPRSIVMLIRYRLSGDLDGDQYFISWNEAIIPETVDPPNPREVSPPSTPLEAKVKKEKSARPAKTYDHMEELRRYIGKRVLSFDIGATAKAWTEAANARELGSRDPYCLALSARYECCLDTNKTGEEIPPIPPDALKGPLRTGTYAHITGDQRRAFDNILYRPLPFRATGLDHPPRDAGSGMPLDVRSRRSHK